MNSSANKLHYIDRMTYGLLVICFLAIPMTVNATLIGSTVDVSYYYPDEATYYCTNGTAVVGAGVEYPFSCSGFSPVSIDITASQLIVDTGGIGWSPAIFNGFLLSVLDANDIISAVYAGGTMAVTGLTIVSGDLWVNFASQDGGIAYIDYIARAGIPEPAPLALMALGLISLGLIRRRKL